MPFFLISLIVQLLSSFYYSNQIVKLNDQSQQQLLTISALSYQHQNLETEWAILNRLENIATQAAQLNLKPIKQSLDFTR